MLHKLPFAFHAAIETAAALSFIFRPETQLPRCTPAAKLILRQYGGLLISSNLICLIVIVQPTLDSTSRLLAAALGSYHLWPSYRALVRLRSSVPGDSTSVSPLGGPALHLAVHIVSIGLFAATAAFGADY